MKTFVLSVLILFFVAASLFAQNTNDSKPLIVGTASGYAPYVSLNAKGEYEGFDIDVAESLANKLNRKMILKDYGTMPSLMLALKQKKVDILIWAISITQERLDKMEMIYYQGDKTLEMPFLFWNKIPEGITAFENLKGNVVAVEAGTFQEGVLKQFQGIDLKYKDSITDAILELKFGKSLAAPIDSSLIGRFTDRFPELKVLNLPLPPDAQALGSGICVNKANQKLTQEIKKVIEEMLVNGEIATLEKKWGLQ